MPGDLVLGYIFDFFSRQAALTTTSFDKKIVPGYNLGRISAGRHIPGFDALHFCHFALHAPSAGIKRTLVLVVYFYVQQDQFWRILVHFEVGFWQAEIDHFLPFLLGYILHAPLGGQKTYPGSSGMFYIRYPPSCCGCTHMIHN